MPSLISLDIETTGLDPNQDAIIEIGAVRFNEKRIEAEYSQLINPRRPVSQFITNLTGISNTMLMNQPYLVDLLPEVLSFIGDATIVGHNVGFDLSFFHKLGALRTNPTIDTYELASVLLPKAARYNLAALAQALGVVQANAHRALDDARATHGVYRRLMEVLESLPIELVAEILRLSKGLNWGGELPFRTVLKNMAQKGIKARKLSKNTEGEIFLPGQERRDLHLKPLEPNKNLQALDVEALASILQPGGEFASHFPAFEHRSQQVQVLKAIAEAFNHSDHLMVEAGTGIGKSLAYLIPAADWAIKNGERVVISTNTIALQDQLISKDIPDLTQALGLNLHAAVLKGRGNYLCPRRLNAMRRRGPETVDELRVLAKILVWRESSQSDDRSEINLNGPVERLVWSRLSAEDENCKLELCLKREGGRCPFYKARMAAEGGAHSYRQPRTFAG